jgi:hypothetical protein
MGLVSSRHFQTPFSFNFKRRPTSNVAAIELGTWSGSLGTFANERCTQSWQGLRACIENNPDSPQEYTLSDLGFNASYDDKEIGITGKNVTVRGNHVVIDAGSNHQEFAKGGFFK